MRTSVLTIEAGRPGHLVNLVAGLLAGDGGADELVVVSMGEPAAVDAGALSLVRSSVPPAAGYLPLSAARNEAARCAGGELLVFLDVDCIPSPDLVSRLSATLGERDAIAMATVGYLPPGLPSTEGGIDFAELSRRALAKPGRELDKPHLEPVGYQHFWSLAFGIRSSTFHERVGGFDTSYIGYGAEDTDFGRRAADAGVELVWAGGAIAYHQHHHSCSPPADRLAEIVHNAWVYRDRWNAWPMEGWLTDFADRGWIEWSPEEDRLEIKRSPTAAELRSLSVP